jgi:hypothetical protein
MIVALIVLGVPFVLFFLLKNKLIAFVVSVAVGVPTLIVNMLVLEQAAEDAEFDFVFAMSLILWAGICILVYGVIFGLLSLFKRCFSTKKMER